MVKAPMAETVVPPQRAVMDPLMSAVMTQVPGETPVAAVVTAMSGTGQGRLGCDRQNCGAYIQETPQESGGLCHGGDLSKATAGVSGH